MAEPRRPIDAQKVALVDEFLKHGFLGDEVLNTYDFNRSAQFYRVGAPGGLRHRVFVSSEFFADHTAGEIEKLLNDWRALETIKRAGARAVIITNSGISVPGTKEETTA